MDKRDNKICDLPWEKGKKIYVFQGVCPDCFCRDTMNDGKGQLWCPQCDASYNYREDEETEALDRK